MNQFIQRYMRLGETFDPESVTLKKSFRVNTLKISAKDLLDRLHKRNVKTEKISFLKDAYYYESDFPLSSTEEYLLGYLYLQEAASQVPCEVLLEGVDVSKLPSDTKFLDMCAAPGSKTTQLAQLLGDKFFIVALDEVAPRLEKIKDNLDRLGISSVITFRKDGRFADDLNMKFDFITLDAPCSGNFCVEHNFFKERSVLLGVKEKSKVQKELLKTAWRLLNVGGTLVYSTCSLEPEEDELIINWFLSFKEDAKLVPINVNVADDGLTTVFGKELHKDIAFTKRFWPHKTGTEGFFIAKLKKLPKIDGDDDF